MWSCWLVGWEKLATLHAKICVPQTKSCIYTYIYINNKYIYIQYTYNNANQLPRELQNHVGVPHLWLNSLPPSKSRGQTRIVQQTTLKCWWTSKKKVELKSNPVSNMNSPRWDVEKPDSLVITMFAKNISVISVFLGVCGRTCMQLCTSMQVALQPSCLLLWTWAGMEACGPTLPKDGPSKPHLWWGKVDRCRQHATVSNKWLDNIFTITRCATQHHPRREHPKRKTW